MSGDYTLRRGLFGVLSGTADTAAEAREKAEGLEGLFGQRVQISGPYGDVKPKGRVGAERFLPWGR